MFDLTGKKALITGPLVALAGQLQPRFMVLGQRLPYLAPASHRLRNWPHNWVNAPMSCLVT